MQARTVRELQSLAPPGHLMLELHLNVRQRSKK